LDNSGESGEYASEAQKIRDWLYSCVHLLAYHYHWSKTEILENVYPDEIEDFRKNIVQSLVTNWRMQAFIAHNPHANDSKMLFNELDRMERGTTGHDYIDAKLDKEGFKSLKEILAKNSKLIKTK
jgi:hypothetical protein